MTAGENESYILDSGYAEFNARIELESHLAALSFDGLTMRPLRKQLVDCSTDRRELRAGMFLAVALALAERWRERIPGKRVAVVMPAGLGGMLVNLALTILDRVPVNLNFTAGRSACEHAIQMAGVETLISAKPVKERVTDFPWPSDYVDLMKERTQLDKKVILKHFLKILALPRGYLRRHYRIPQNGGRREAGLLFRVAVRAIPRGFR